MSRPWGVVEDGVQWSEGDSWSVGERAEGAGSVGERGLRSTRGTRMKTE